MSVNRIKIVFKSSHRAPLSLSPYVLLLGNEAIVTNTIVNEFSLLNKPNTNLLINHAGNLVKSSGHHTEGENPEITWKNLLGTRFKNSFLIPYIIDA
jgi:hypothetical protein